MLGRSVAGSVGRERRGDVREAGGPGGMGTDAGSFRRRLGGKEVPGGGGKGGGRARWDGKLNAGSFRRRLGGKEAPGGM